jgi:hypothetical protein
MRLSEGRDPAKEGTLRVKATKPRARLEVTADGDGVVGHAGAALLVGLADRLGCRLSWIAWWAEGSQAGLGTGPARC